jgi:HD-like signal output (HDOD) protein
VGLWDWVMDKLAGDQKSSETTARAADQTGPGRENAIAVAEPPAGSVAAESGDCWWVRPDAHLTELAPVPRTQLSAELLALENIIASYFDGHDMNLPQMPRVPEVVLRELSSTDYSLRKIGREIAADQVSAASVLRLANSPLYRGMNQITAVEPAVIRLGAGAIRTLMLHQTMSALTRAERRASQRLAEILSVRSVACGATMRLLSKFTGMDPEEAFIVGLLHDIGSVMVLRIINRQKPYAGRVDFDTFEFLAYETHQEFGELLADSWNLPPKLGAILSNHHAYPDEHDPFRTDRLALHVTNIIGGLLGFAFEAPYDLLNARALQDLGLADHPDFMQFLARLPDDIDDALQAFG